VRWINQKTLIKFGLSKKTSTKASKLSEFGFKNGFVLIMLDIVLKIDQEFETRLEESLV